MKSLSLFTSLSLLLFRGLLFPSELKAQTDPNHPNILLIISDDVGVDISNGYQNNPVMPTTPTLDELRKNGLTFMNAWSTPMCTPTRAAIMSGKYGVKTGVLKAPGNLGLSHTSVFNELASQSNDLYNGAVIGKWHISHPVDYDHPADHGVDHYEGLFESGVADYYSWDKVINGKTSNETTYATSYFTDAALDWVKDQQNPWFLWLAEVAPHSPYHVPPAELYSISSVSSNLEKYVAAIEAMDAEIGRLLDGIPDSVMKNTLIIYIGDNGTPGNVIQSYPRGHGKGTLYQGGIHVPFVVSGPLVSRQGETEDAMVHVADIHATILEATGNDLPGGLYNSQSFWHLLLNSTEPKRQYNYSEIEADGEMHWTIREERFKLIEFEDGTQEFYDLENDPLETNNLLPNLIPNRELIKADLEEEAENIRTSWSCRDQIQNGDEEGIDCGGSHCEPCDGTGILEVNAEMVSIFPNPTKGQLIIKGTQHTILSLRIYTADGRLVYASNDIAEQVVVDLKEFDTNLFLVNVVTAQGYTSQLVVKEQ